jgi:hypothetical protein
MSIEAYPSPNGVLTSLIWRKTMSGGETSLSGYDNASQALSYTPGQEQVYLNGILLVRGDDYTATNGTSITGLSALAASDFVQVNCYNNFSVASVPSQNITGTIANNQLQNSAITINGSAISLGGSVTLAGDIESVTAGTGLTGGGTSGSVTLALDSSSVISPTIVNAKGDILTASADNVPAILTAGNSGETLVADSSTSTGLRYQPTMAAGKNFIINGGMDIWQRGTSFTNPGSTYTVDRWTSYWSANGTVTQETSNVPAGCRYALKMTATANSGGNNFYQLIETNNTIPLAGKTVTFSIYVAGTAGKTPTIGIDTSTVVDDSLFGSWSTLVSSSSVTTSTTYQRVSVTGTIPSNTKSIRVNINSASVNNTDYILWSGAQLEIGSVPTTFSRAGGTIQGELAACQRYYARFGGTIYNAIGTGVYVASTVCRIFIPMPVFMRTAPTLSNSTASDFGIFNGSGNDQASGLSANSLDINSAALDFTVTARTAGYAGIVNTRTNSSAFIAFSSEL